MLKFSFVLIKLNSMCFLSAEDKEVMAEMFSLLSTWAFSNGGYKLLFCAMNT